MFLNKMSEDNYSPKSRIKREINPSTFYGQETEELNRRLQEQFRKDNPRFNSTEIEWLEEKEKESMWI